MVAIRPLPMPKMTLPTIMRAKDWISAAIAVSKQPTMTKPLTARVPHDEPNASMKKPPAMGKIVFMIDTLEDKTPYRVLSISSFCFKPKVMLIHTEDGEVS